MNSDQEKYPISRSFRNKFNVKSWAHFHFGLFCLLNMLMHEQSFRRQIIFDKEWLLKMLLINDHSFLNIPIFMYFGQYS